MKVNGGEINLLGGITEQPVDRRADGTVSQAVDLVIDPVYGLRRRNPWTTSRVFNTRPQLGEKTWYIDVELYDETYTLVISGFTSTLRARVYITNLIGDWEEVSLDDAVAEYLYVFGNPSSNPYKATAFDNNIVVVNTDVIPRLVFNGGLQDLRTDQKYCTLIGSNYNRSYTVTVSSVSEAYELTYSYTTPEVDDGALTPQEIADALQPATIVADLAAQIEADLGNSVFHATASGNVLEIYPDPDEYHTDMIVNLDDGDNLNNFTLVDRIVTSTDDLPARARYSDYLIVRTNDREESSEYYLVYVSKDDIIGKVYPYTIGTELTNDGVWVETYKNKTNVDLTNMPILITRDDTVWSSVFDSTLFTPRLVGNDANNTPPSFINLDTQAENQAIVDCFYVQNRLVLVTASSFIFSQTNKPFNLWKDSAVTLLDSDRIDISAGVSEGGAFITASQINDDILILTDRSQYGINASNALTPRTAVIRLLTRYPCRAEIGAVSMGATAAFVVKNGDSVQIREIAPRAGVTGNYTSEVLTAQIPNTIDTSVFKLITAPNDSIMLAITDDAVYAYYWYDVGGQRQIQAWTKWAAFDRYTHVTIKDSVLYGFVQTEVNGELLRIDKLDVGLRKVTTVDDQDVFSDQRQGLIFNEGSSQSSGNISDSFSVAEINDLAIGTQILVDDEGYPLNYTYNAILDKLVVDEPNVKPPYVEYFIGYPYTSSVKLSPTIPKDQEGNEIDAYKLVLRDMTFRLSNTGIVKVDVSIDNVDNYMYEDSYLSERIISMSGLNDLSHIRTYKFEVPIREDSRDVNITVNSVGVDPFILTGYDWIGQIRGSGQRRIY